jgi:hypothetical protein
LALSVAAAVVLAVGVWLLPDHHAPGPGAVAPSKPAPVAEKPAEPGSDGHDVALPPEQASDDEPRVRVSLADPSEAILVPVETCNPNVSVVWIYPTVRPGHGATEPAAGSP